MQPILEICYGNFCPSGHHFRLLDLAEMQRVFERIDIDRLRERGVYLDAFDPRPFNQRRRYKVAAALELPENFDPFDVSELVELEEQTIEWALDDRAAAARFARASRPSLLDASLDATNLWLQARDPFRPTGDIR
jgi:hypothetical protein